MRVCVQVDMHALARALATVSLRADGSRGLAAAGEAAFVSARRAGGWGPTSRGRARRNAAEGERACCCIYADIQHQPRGKELQICTWSEGISGS